MGGFKPQYCLNGAFFYYENKQLDFTNRAFRFGDAVFESMFVTSKQSPLLYKHLARLKEAMQYFEMKLPDDFTEQRLAKEIERLCNKNRLFQGARARLTVFRGGEGLYTPTTNNAEYLLEVSYFPEEEFVLNEKGWRIGIYSEEVKYPLQSARYKTAQCLLSVKGSLYKQRFGLDEVLFLSPEKNIVEAIAYNIFALKGNTLLTPKLGNGCVAGVMRDTVLEYANRLDLWAEEVDFPIEILNDADEVFLTNAVVGIRQVLSSPQKIYSKKMTEKIVTLLNDELLYARR